MTIARLFWTSGPLSLVVLLGTGGCQGDDGRPYNPFGTGLGGVSGLELDSDSEGESGEASTDDGGEADDSSTSGGDDGGGPADTAPPADPSSGDSSDGMDEPPPVPDDVEHCEIDGRLVVEAEHYTSQVGYAQIDRADASNGSVMQVGDDGSLDFEVWFATSGRVTFWVRTYVSSNDDQNNGLFLHLDDERLEAPEGHPQAGAPHIYLKKVGWSWSPEWRDDNGHEGPVSFDIEAGTHVLSIRKRLVERPEIDKIVLEFEEDEPSDLGPGPTLCAEL